MPEFKLVDEQCADCGHPMPSKTGYWVRDALSSHRRHICGFCWCNPGWPSLDPGYRERQITDYRQRFHPVLAHTVGFGEQRY